MKRFFGKRRATRTTLGELTARPLERLGALVFQPDNSERIMLGQLLGCDPDSRLCVELCSAITRWENVLSEKPLLTLPNNTTTPRPAIRRAPGFGSGQDPQGIARHVPSCPAALHLDRLDLRQSCAAKELPSKICSLQNLLFAKYELKQKIQRGLTPVLIAGWNMVLRWLQSGAIGRYGRLDDREFFRYSRLFSCLPAILKYFLREGTLTGGITQI